MATGLQSGLSLHLEGSNVQRPLNAISTHVETDFSRHRWARQPDTRPTGNCQGLDSATPKQLTHRKNSNLVSQEGEEASIVCIALAFDLFRLISTSPYHATPNQIKFQREPPSKFIPPQHLPNQHHTTVWVMRRLVLSAEPKVFTRRVQYQVLASYALETLPPSTTDALL